MHRTVRSQETVADSALRDYAHFATWSYQQYLRDQLGRAAKEVLGPVYHGHYVHTVRHVPAAGEIASYLPWDAACRCRRAETGYTPRAYYAWTLGANAVTVARNVFADPDRGWRSDSVVRHRTARSAHAADDGAVLDGQLVRDTIVALVRSGYRSDWGFTYIVPARRPDATVLLYTLMPTAWGDTVVYAAAMGSRAVAGLLADAFDEQGLLPWTFTRGRPTRALLAGEVLDASGRPLFSTDSGWRWVLDARQELPASYGGLVAHLEIRPELATQLIIGGLPRSRVPFLLTLLALAAALSVVAAMQLRREGELATLRSDFVANVSHELRTPLSQIQLDLDTLRLGRYDTETLRDAILQRMDRETRRLTYLTENVLRFSRHGREGGWVRVPTDVASDVAAIVEEFRPLAAARRTTLATDIHPTPPLALEPDALRQIVLNLLDNAVKYGPPDQVVHVRVEHAEATPHVVRLSVTDEGPGVRPSERDRIWQPFVRGSSSVRRGIGGSGIGLTIVHDTVTRHGGRVRVADASDTGHAEGAGRGGAEFVVELPIRDLRPPPPTPSPPPPPAMRRPAPSASPAPLASAHTFGRPNVSHQV